jgi:lipid-binding SYLF domain-containing protein
MIPVWDALHPSGQRAMFYPMKTTMLVCTVLAFASAALAIGPAELDNRIGTLTAKFEAFQQQPGRGIPAETLRAAQGIILLDRTKAGFLFAYQGGGGVALVRDAQTREWSPVAFLGASEASLGFQIGGEQDFYVILLMTTNATSALANPNIEFGGEARGTAGNSAPAEWKANCPVRNNRCWSMTIGRDSTAARSSKAAPSHPMTRAIAPITGNT